MDIIVGSTTKDDVSGQVQQSEWLAKQHKDQQVLFILPIHEWIILSVLTIAALLPRMLLATQLDVVTDEVIYIAAGKTYLPLLLHFQVSADGWSYNYEHPSFVKLLIGLTVDLNIHLGSLLNELLVARIPSLLSGTLLILAIYCLGRAPFGRIIALLAALCLAASPWLVYFSALAYLDMTMTMLITGAYLLLWHAIQQPRLYTLAAALLGLAVASKYTAVLALPGMILFTSYYFVALRPRLPAEQQAPMPWRWWLSASLVLPVTFYIADPSIWRHPLDLLLHSVLFEWHHSVTGHLMFIAGHYSEHVAHWAVLYIVIVKMSAFVTVPCAFFVIFALVQLLRFHLSKSNRQIIEITSIAFLLIWLLSMLSMFCLLNIVVGTHYELPLAPPVALAGAFGLATLLRYRRGTLFHPVAKYHLTSARLPVSIKHSPNRRARVTLAILALFLIGPHLLGLTTVYATEGYTSEFFPGEDTTLQVAYPAYREAGLWLVAHTSRSSSVGLVVIVGRTLDPGFDTTSWYRYNAHLMRRLTFTEVLPGDRSFPYDYLVWPMHLVQRGYTIPDQWRSRIVHTLTGGKTIYCFILARNPATIIS